jgi:hypothetical protein
MDWMIKRTTNIISVTMLPAYIRELLPLFVAWKFCTNFFRSSRLIPECEVKKDKAVSTHMLPELPTVSHPAYT